MRYTIMTKQDFEEVVRLVGTHKDGDDLGYCDTGADMGNRCRSECVDMAIDRLREHFIKDLT